MTQPLTAAVPQIVWRVKTKDRDFAWSAPNDIGALLRDLHYRDIIPTFIETMDEYDARMAAQIRGESA